MAISYSDKLKDPRWLARREEILRRDGYRCRNCGARDGDDHHVILNAHHKTYISGRDPWDYTDDYLITYCRECRQDAHDAMAALTLLIYENTDGNVRRIKRDMSQWVEIWRKDWVDVLRAATALSKGMSKEEGVRFVKLFLRMTERDNTDNARPIRETINDWCLARGIEVAP